MPPQEPHFEQEMIHADMTTRDGESCGYESLCNELRCLNEFQCLDSSKLKSADTFSRERDGMLKAEEVRKTQTASNGWRLRMNPSVMALRNPIREITECMSLPNHEKRVISLAVGDPSSSGLVTAPAVATDALVNTARAGLSNGYTNSCGAEECREAIASTADVQPQDVFVCQGCSQGLMHSIAALAAPNANILLPKPGFPLYQVLAEYYGIEVRYYDLKPNAQWEADLDMIRALHDENTCALLVCNPSNPCGAVFSREHLEDIASVAAALYIPIIADEVYAGISWGPKPFVSMANVAKMSDDISHRVPVIEVGAISKRFVVPGWRLGWIILHDYNSILKNSGLYSAITKLQQITLSANSLVQASLPSLLQDCPPDYSENLNDSLEKAADFCFIRCNDIPGLTAASKPYGAMYLMMKINCAEFDDSIMDDRDFADMLIREESVRVLPGQCFGIPGYIRIVFAAPQHDLHEAWNRIEQFCRRHSM